MKFLNTLLLCLALASSGALANLLPAGKDTEDIWLMPWNASAAMAALQNREAHPAWRERSEGKPAPRSA